MSNSLMVPVAPEAFAPRPGTAFMNFVLPTLGLCTCEELYFKPVQGVSAYSYAERSIRLRVDAKVSFGTYFNGLSIGKWRAKTTLSSALFSLDFGGRLSLKFVHHRKGFSDAVLHEAVVETQARETTRFALPFWAEVDTGIVSVVATALSDSVVYGAAYETHDEPAQGIRVGMVVTTFRRERQVMATVERLRRDLVGDPAFSEAMALVVVDNGGTLDLGSADDLVVIRNRNLGGSGGFMRGLAYLTDVPGFTHCLFMDDDASCEIESLRRVLRLFQYARRQDLSVCGSMFLEHKSHVQHESGAAYDNGRALALKTDLDMRKMSNLLANEVDEKVDYSGWWMTAFPLSAVSRMAFPFFVRGDDILFSMHNLANVTTLNGIASWQQDFDHKETPMVEYLSTRSLVAIALMADRDFSAKVVGRRFLRRVVSLSFKYNYDRAACACEAMRDVLAGPGFWRGNVDMSAKRKVVDAIVLEERSSLHVDASAFQPYGYFPRIRIPRSVRVPLKALASHLLPNFMLKPDEDVRCSALSKRIVDAAFRRRSYVQYVFDMDKGYRLTRSRSRFLALLRDGVWLYLRFRFSSPGLREAYRAAMPELTSRAFWDAQFSEEAVSPPVPALDAAAVPQAA